MPNIYTVIRKPISMEEKEQRYDSAMRDPFYFGPKPDRVTFLASEIYDEYVRFKCLKCDYEQDVEFEEIQWLLEDEDHDRFRTYCPECNRSQWVPVDLYKKLKK